MKPAKMRSVACPSTFGPSVERITEATVRTKPSPTASRNGLSRARSRLAEPRKFSDFSTGIAILGP